MARMCVAYKEGGNSAASTTFAGNRAQSYERKIEDSDAESIATCDIPIQSIEVDDHSKYSTRYLLHYEFANHRHIDTHHPVPAPRGPSFPRFSRTNTQTQYQAVPVDHGPVGRCQNILCSTCSQLTLFRSSVGPSSCIGIPILWSD